MFPIVSTKSHLIHTLGFFFVLLHIAISRKDRLNYQGGNYPIISHLRPDTQNSHLAWVYWSFDRSPLAYERFELYKCIHNETFKGIHSVPNTELLAEVPNAQFEAIIKNMPETKKPCVIVCAILREGLASCSKQFACFNTKYSIPSGSMRLMHSYIAPIMVKAKRDFNTLKISWDFPFPEMKNSFFLIDINYGSDQSYQSIDKMLHLTEVVQRLDSRVDIRLDGSQIEAEKFAFVKVCSIERVNHRDRKNCSEQLVLPLSEIEEDLEEDMAVEITGIEAHIHSANVILGEPLENRKTSELSVMCIADHETERISGTSARVLEWRTSNMRGNILNLESLNPATRYKCSIQARPLLDSMAYTIYAKKEFRFRTKSIEIENPSVPVISGSQYVLEGMTIVHPFSIRLEPTEPEVEISSYLLVAWPQHTTLPTQFDNNSASTLTQASNKEKSVPFTQEILSPDLLPIEYMFDFAVNKNAYKQDECYYFLLAAVPFETNSSYPFSTSNTCIKFSYTEKVAVMNSRIKKIGLIFVILITVGMLVTVLVIMVFVTWKLRIWLKQSGDSIDDDRDGLDLVLNMWDKVRGKTEYREDDVREVLVSKSNDNSGFIAESDTSTHEIGPIINQEYNEFSSD